MMTRDRKEIIERTMFNLVYIKDLKGKNGPYEVTQLVNSFLMTLLQNWDDLEEGWPHLKQCGIEWPKIKTSEPGMQASQCIGKIRDALAHGCFVFEEGEGGHIGSICLWTCPNQTTVDWHAHIEVAEMEAMLRCFAEIAKQQPLQPSKAKSKGDPCL